MEFLQILFLGIGLMTLVFLSCIFFDIAYNDFQHKYIEYHSNRVKLLVLANVGGFLDLQEHLLHTS